MRRPWRGLGDGRGAPAAAGCGSAWVAQAESGFPDLPWLLPVKMCVRSLTIPALTRVYAVDPGV